MGYSCTQAALLLLFAMISTGDFESARLTALAAGLATVFDESEDIFVFMKDRDRRFVNCSPSFAKLLGFDSHLDLVGLRDEDVSPEYLADHYRENDEWLLSTGGRLTDLVELVRNLDGSYDWFLTTKAAVLDDRGDVHGIVGQTRPLVKKAAPNSGIHSLTPAIELISRRYAEPLTVPELAASIPSSPSAFTREFRAHFGTTPYQYLLRVRIMAACDLLSTTELSLAAIALRTGFYDASHLARVFREDRSVTPAQYRRTYQA
jgi:PAS domain S-box-containing protein